MICEEFDDAGSNRLVLGHVDQLHYVSLIPHKGGKDVWFKVARLDFFFLGRGNLPKLSISYVAMSKEMEKRFPLVYYIKMKIPYDLGFIAIEVAMAT